MICTKALYGIFDVIPSKTFAKWRNFIIFVILIPLGNVSLIFSSELSHKLCLFLITVRAIHNLFHCLVNINRMLARERK